MKETDITSDDYVELIDRVMIDLILQIKQEHYFIQIGLKQNMEKIMQVFFKIDKLKQFEKI